MKKYVIIVAGGKGTRMQAAVPKQFLEISGLPVLMHTFQAFNKSKLDLNYILVLPSEHIHTWKSLCSQFSFNLPHRIAEGGPARFHSVKSGLKWVEEEDTLVAVHDAVRPWVSADLIERVFNDAELHGNAIPCVPVNESIRERSGTVSRSVRREQFVLIQTPQCFRGDLLKKAYLQTYREEFTDDATVFEHDGGQVRLVAGDPHNFKITGPPDLDILSALLCNK